MGARRSTAFTSELSELLFEPDYFNRKYPDLNLHHEPLFKSIKDLAEAIVNAGDEYQGRTLQSIQSYLALILRGERPVPTGMSQYLRRAIYERIELVFGNSVARETSIERILTDYHYQYKKHRSSDPYQPNTLYKALIDDVSTAREILLYKQGKFQRLYPIIPPPRPSQIEDKELMDVFLERLNFHPYPSNNWVKIKIFTPDEKSAAYTWMELFDRAIELHKIEDQETKALLLYNLLLANRNGGIEVSYSKLDSITFFTDVVVINPFPITHTKIYAYAIHSNYANDPSIMLLNEDQVSKWFENSFSMHKQYINLRIDELEPFRNIMETSDLKRMFLRIIGNSEN